MIAVLAALMFAVAPVDHRPYCALSRLALCRTTNQLVWDKAFGAVVSRFLGDGRATYLYRGGLADQMISALGGPPDDPVRIGNFYRFTACRQHQCNDKGAAVLDPTGRLVALAILHGACEEDGCEHRYALTIFVGNPTDSKPVVENLTAWASKAVTSAHVSPGSPPDILDKVEVIPAATLAHARRRCALSRLSACLDTDDLMHDRAARVPVQRFLGPERAKRHFSGGLNDTVNEVLWGVADPPSRIGEMYRFTARFIDASVALVFHRGGRLMAVAVAHDLCREPGAPSDCYEHITLTIFSEESGAPKPVVENLRAWVTAGLRTSEQGMALDKVEILPVAPAGRPLPEPERQKPSRRSHPLR